MSGSLYYPVKLSRGDDVYLINIKMDENSTSSPLRDEFDYYESVERIERDLVLVWDIDLQTLTDVQRLIFLVLTILVVIVAVVGNLLVLYVNLSRKQRFLFRMCLISLAVSDLIFAIVTSCVYLPKFVMKNSLLWIFGPSICSLFPFLQTMVVLANSIMLVCIAFDRYMAVVRIVKGAWEPSKLFCIACCTIIWGFSAAVSSPLLAIYEHYKVYIVPVPEDGDGKDELTYFVGYLCGSDKEENGYYFAIISTFIFGPLFVTFIWLNSVLAKEVWKRRIDMTVSVIESENISASTMTAGLNSSEICKRRIERRQRQVKMFKVILALMAVFFICRMPNWVFLLYKLGDVPQDNLHWVINYALGLLVMANCMANPFLYTFLSETIRLTTFLTGIIIGIFKSLFNLITCKIIRKRNRNDFNKEEKQQYFDKM